MVPGVRGKLFKHASIFKKRKQLDQLVPVHTFAQRKDGEVDTLEINHRVSIANIIG